MAQLNEAHQQLASAKGQVTRNTSQLLPNELEAIIGEIAEEFHVGINYGLEGKDISKLSPSKQFTLRFEKIVQNVIRNMDANGISNAANYLFAKAKDTDNMLYSRKYLLTKAKRELSKVTKKLLDDELTLIFDRIEFEFRVDLDFGVAEMDLRGMTSLEIFNKKLEKVLTERVDYDDPNGIGKAALALHKHSNFKRNEPSSLAAICELVAAFMDCPAYELANATTENAQRVFGLELEDNHHHQQQEQQQQQCNNENDESSVVN
ncbi:hypothetical protein niasHT_021556 [Heterodera trifolii]|uniref:Uncharacterized protein n=1 Tax=Heterodera trifolii TaxID=157864 RepID=A0ABD2KS12_9BILA